MTPVDIINKKLLANEYSQTRRSLAGGREEDDTPRGGRERGGEEVDTLD